MSDLLRKGFMIGLGAALSSKEKAEKMIDELIQKGQVSPGEARDMMEQLYEKGEQHNQQWGAQSKEYFKKNIQELGFVTKEEYHALELRLEKLENQMNQEE